jgi:antitoxin ParD1/3/4
MEANMETSGLHIVLPPLLAEYVQEQAAAGSFRTPDEFVVSLVDADRKRKAIEELEGLIQEGLDSGPPIEVTEEFWEQRRRVLEEKIRQMHPS